MMWYTINCNWKFGYIIFYRISGFYRQILSQTDRLRVLNNTRTPCVGRTQIERDRQRRQGNQPM